MQEVIIKTVRAGRFVTKLIPVITTTAYTAGDVVGGIQTIPISSTGGVIQSLGISDNADQKAAFDILIFDALPTSSADNAAFVWHSDITKLVARISVATGDYLELVSKAFAQKSGLNLVVSPGTTSVYAVVVTSSTPTYAVGDLQFDWGVV
jgi:hypothetical protein